MSFGQLTLLAGPDDEESDQDGVSRRCDAVSFNLIADAVELSGTALIKIPIEPKKTAYSRS